MRILYISSGYTRIYRYFDRSIILAIKQLNNANVRPVSPSIKTEDLSDIIKHFKPNIMITLLGDRLPKETLQFLRSSNVATAVWLTEDPFYFDETIELIPPYDYVFTVDLGALEAYKEFGYTNAYHIPLGTNPAVFKPKPINGRYTSDICLVGYPYLDRVDMINMLLKETPFQIKGVGSGWKKHFRSNVRDNFEIIDRWISPEKVADYYSNSKIVLNSQRPFDEKSNKNQHLTHSKSINNRTFDIAACNGFQIVQSMKDLSIHFTLDKEIISFNSHDELLEKIHLFIDQPNKREIIAAKARENTILNHTFKQRMETMLSIIRKA
jgi:spore maturation protein CgeB